MSFRICDSNVLIAANGRYTHADVECQLSCVEALMNLIKSDILVLDSTDEIIDEYVRHTSYSGQPGVGDAFFKHIYDNKYNSKSCLLVTITAIANTYSEVPREINDAGFDKSDQKFVAVAISSGVNPVILNATDSDWYIHRNELESHDINVLQLCPQHQDRDN